MREFASSPGGGPVRRHGGSERRLSRAGLKVFKPGSRGLVLSYPIGQRVRHLLATIAVAGAFLAAAHFAKGISSGAARGGAAEAALAPLGSFAPGDLVARLSVERLGLDVPVREGIGSEILATSAGHVPGTALPGEAGARGSLIAIPRTDRWEDAQDLRLGDRIEIKTPFGARTYCVVERRILRPDEVRGATFGGAAVKTGRVTLIMAHPANTLGPAPQRLAIVADTV